MRSASTGRLAAPGYRLHASVPIPQDSAPNHRPWSNDCTETISSWRRTRY